MLWEVEVFPLGHDAERQRAGAEYDLLVHGREAHASGAETIAHVRQNERITVMFCAFDGKPNIVRLHGRGQVVRPDDAAFDALAARFPETPRGTRSIIRVAVDRVSDSCGFGVPFMDFVGSRENMATWTAHKSDEALAAYMAEKNATSIDGLPAVD